MKKIVLSLLLLPGLLFAQNVNIPDANFKAYLVGNSNINTNGDSEIQISEAVAYTGSIYCPGYSISDLTGIEAFVNISVLHCGFNSITAIDLSQNNLLTSVNIMFNQITSLNISNLTLLTELTCTGNQLTSLDVSNNLALIGLSCGGNQITGTLDLNNHTSLSGLNCFNNQLTGLKAKNGNNTNFTTFYVGGNQISCIEVDDPAYSYANWAPSGSFGYDASAIFSVDCDALCNVNIPDANFKAYLVDNSLINTNGDWEIQCSEAQAYTGFINVYNLNIADLTGIEAFTGITALNCGENQLTSLNLTNNAALLSINCSGNQLTTLDISAQTVLTELYCDGNQLTSLNTSNNAALSVLWCNSNQLSALDVSSNLALTVLQCNMNLLTSINTSNNTMLTSLGCTGNQLTALDMSSNTALIELGCQNNNLSSLNLKNGNNANMTLLYVVGGNSGLTCIEVDDAAYCNANWTGSGFMLDPQTSFSEDCSTASVSENSLENLVILFPNPTRDLVHFSAPSNFHLTNVAGQILMSGSAMNSLDLSNQPAGIYFLIFTDAAGNVIQHNKIVKE